MSAPDELQDPLLGADFVNITCHGVRATLVVDAEGGISYAPLKVSWHHCLLAQLGVADVGRATLSRPCLWTLTS